MIRYFSIVVIVCLFGCTLKSSSNSQSPESSIVSVVPDITDDHTLFAKADALLQLFNCDVYFSGHCIFRIRPITDRQLTPISYCMLPNAHVTEMNNTQDDPQHRRKTIEAFYQKVKQLIADFNTRYDTIQELGNSECIRSISEELQYLASDTSDRKFLVVYSNLREKSDLLDSYSNSDLTSVMIATTIEDLRLLPDQLKGITVFFVFEARDRPEDRIYMKLAEAYKMVIERRGGIVNLQATDASFIL